jgi:hypothetical protein
MRFRSGLSVALLAAAVVVAAGAHPQRASAQDTATTTAARNSVFVELWGNGFFYSVNYDRKISEKFSLRGGLGGWSVDDLILEPAVVAPVLVNSLIGEGVHRLELGAGVTTGVRWEPNYGAPGGTTHNPKTILMPTATLGYRYQPVESGWLFRASLTPVGTDYIWIGISLGRAW